MAVAIARPKRDGNIAVGDDRQIGFAEFGDPQGRAAFWLHGTPGARRQIPMEARVYAEQRQIRLIGVDRPARAHQAAARIVETHGSTITVEDATISAWARLWGKRIALFSPGMLVAALARECAAAGGTLQRPGRLHTCPHPAGGAGLPARVGGLSQPAPATSII